jgi:hypothetical protein
LSCLPLLLCWIGKYSLLISISSVGLRYRFTVFFNGQFWVHSRNGLHRIIKTSVKHCITRYNQVFNLSGKQV